MQPLRIFFLSVFLSMIVMVIHVLPFNNSMINFRNVNYNNHENWLSKEYLTDVVIFHKSGESAFAMRPLSTKFIHLVAENTGLEVAESFVLVQWFFLIISGLVLGLLSNFLLGDLTKTQANLIVYYSSFTILFMFFAPIYSYDEPLQYLLVFLSLLFFMQEKNLFFILFFSLACITRESTLFLIPALFILKYGSFKIQWKTFSKSLLLFVPIISIFVAFRLVYSASLQLSFDTQNVAARFVALKTNFGGFQPFQNTVISMLVVMLPFLYIFWWNFKFEPKLFEKHRQSLLALGVGLLINTTIVLLLTNAREARLFYLPFLLVLPIMGDFVNAKFLRVFEKEALMKLLKNHKQLLILFGFTVCNAAYSMVYFRFEFTAQRFNFFNEYLFLLLNSVFMHWFLSRNPDLSNFD